MLSQETQVSLVYTIGVKPSFPKRESLIIPHSLSL